MDPKDLKTIFRLSDRTHDYLAARSQAPMMIPVGTPSTGIETRYPVANPPAPMKKPVSILPPDLKQPH
jgi:hypothetical protein